MRVAVARKIGCIDVNECNSPGPSRMLPQLADLETHSKIHVQWEEYLDTCFMEFGHMIRSKAFGGQHTHTLGRKNYCLNVYEAKGYDACWRYRRDVGMTEKGLMYEHVAY